jgi:hypothetical protein
MGGMGGDQSKNALLECVLKNFKGGFNGDCGLKLTPGKLRTFCEIGQPAFDVGWPSDGSLDKVIVNRVFEVDVGSLDTQMVPYIDCWQDAVFSQATWLKPHLEKACSVMVARVATASKYREKCKNPEKPILVENPEDPLPPMCHCTDWRISRSCRFLPDLDPQLLSLGKTPL